MKMEMETEVELDVEMEKARIKRWRVVAVGYLLAWRCFLLALYVVTVSWLADTQKLETWRLGDTRAWGRALLGTPVQSLHCNELVFVLVDMFIFGGEYKPRRCMIGEPLTSGASSSVRAIL